MSPVQWIVGYFRPPTVLRKSPAKLTYCQWYRKALSSPCVGVRVPPLCDFTYSHDIHTTRR